nr:tetratricopeptide repeat protein [Shinella daejeonensis]
MMRIAVPHVFRFLPVALCAVLIACPAGALAEDVPAPSGGPAGMAVEGDGSAPVKTDTEEEKPAASKTVADDAVDGADIKGDRPVEGPSSGLGVFDRMGADLPELPEEKPFEGKVDEAYGAFQRGHYLTAMDLALPRAQLGDPAAQTLVAEILDRGLGVRRNRGQAAFWYEQAANGGDPAAMFKYALILMEKGKSPEDRARADDFMKKAADLGNGSAQFNYAQVLVARTPGDKGLREALPYYEKSAEQGIADAQYAISQIYLNVSGLPEEKRKAARDWLTRAARAGYDTAQLDLAIWLVNGTGGERDFEAAFQWMKRAADGGNVVAQSKLAHLYINAIGTRPDPVEAAKWFVLARRAGLNDPMLEDFYLGLTDEEQKAAITAANRYRSAS